MSSTQWIQTYTGRQFWPLKPSVGDVAIEDIAHALSLKCRFSGHCRKFYSVAEHSLFVSYHVPAKDALWGLLHDAAEAYLPDVARPIKADLTGFQEIEDRLLQVIAEWAGLTWPMPVSVADADVRLLATERLQLMGPSPAPWSIEHVPPVLIPALGASPGIAEDFFLDRWARLRTQTICGNDQ